MGQITHDMLNSPAVAVPISFVITQIFQRFMSVRPEQEKKKSGIPPLDGLVADDDGREKEDNWGTAHRSKHYNVHLHPPGPQRHYGIFHLDKKRRGARGERCGSRRKEWIKSVQNKKKHNYDYTAHHFRQNPDSSLVIRVLVIVLYNIITGQHGGDFLPCSLSWEDAVSSPVL